MNEMLTPGHTAALNQIQDLVGPGGWISDAADMTPHLVEERGLFSGTCAAVVKPATTEEVAGVVSICAGACLPIVPQSGNTSLVGGSIPFDGDAGIVLNLSRMNRIREIDTANFTITAEAGCILADVQNAAEDADRLFPLSLGAEGSCQIGGNISTNAGGVNVVRYGNMRDLVLGLEVVLPDGKVWDGLTGLRKDNTGYNLKHLYIGGEGTLGVVTAAVLKLFPRPLRQETAFVAVRDPAAALDILSRLRSATSDGVTSFELMPRIAIDMVLRHVPGTTDPLQESYEHYVLLEVASGRDDDLLRAGLEAELAAAMEGGLLHDAVIAESGAQAQALWALREGLPEAQKPEGGSIKHDISVPVSKVPAFLDEASSACEAAIPGIRVVGFGHLGDGNIHFNLSQPLEGWETADYLDQWERINRIVHDIVDGLGGSISAEHGIGRLKKSDLRHYKSEVELDVMRAVKAALDPKGIMNPGKIL
jgi:FAD/FMN-containing dehydrogenase